MEVKVNVVGDYRFEDPLILSPTSLASKFILLLVLR
jgi:hypothetical protein